jgi:hypothetical protein
MRFPQVSEPSPALALAVTERVWDCVSLQWEWLGGEVAQRPERERPAGRPSAAVAERDTAHEGVPEEARAA